MPLWWYLRQCLHASTLMAENFLWHPTPCSLKPPAWSQGYYWFLKTLSLIATKMVEWGGQKYGFFLLFLEEGDILHRVDRRAKSNQHEGRGWRMLGRLPGYQTNRKHYKIIKQLAANTLWKLFPRGLGWIMRSLHGPSAGTAKPDILCEQITAYHAGVHCARFIACTYHPVGDCLHVKVGLTLFQRNNAHLSLLQFKRHWSQRRKYIRWLNGPKLRATQVGNTWYYISRESCFAVERTRLVL